MFGCSLVNDWSACGLQFVESMLGPHLGKSFLTTVSPWIDDAAAAANRRRRSAGAEEDCLPKSAPPVYGPDALRHALTLMLVAPPAASVLIWLARRRLRAVDAR